MRVGLLGVGHMGEPMARNLLRAGVPLSVWSRDPAKSATLVDLGAQRAESVEALCRHCDVILLMLLHHAAVDAVLERGLPTFAAHVAGRTVVQLGTTSAEYSQGLAHDIRAASGRYVEAPVSGSRVPAQEGRLIGMIAGDSAEIEMVLPLLSPLCAQVFRCGDVPGAMKMKLAVNHFLIGMVTVLAETVHAARAAEVDLELLRQILDAGPMASTVSRAKLDKFVHVDFSPQAAIRDVGTIAQLVFDQCRAAGAEAPFIARCVDLYRAADAAGHGDDDMAAVIHAFQNRAPEQA